VSRATSPQRSPPRAASRTAARSFAGPCPASILGGLPPDDAKALRPDGSPMEEGADGAEDPEAVAMFQAVLDHYGEA
jgi:hypothetical protein